MPTTRSYRDSCGIARALDVVGERWALLVVRELLLGPQRFSDLRSALAGASTNMVADRLRELEANGVVIRRKLAPPAASWTYELTGRGRDLEPIVIALGTWGLQVPRPPAPSALTATSVLIYLRTAARPDVDAPAATYRLDLDGRVVTVRLIDGRADVEPGEPANPVASVVVSPKDLNALFDDPAGLSGARDAEVVTIEGDVDAVRRLLDAVHG